MGYRSSGCGGVGGLFFIYLFFFLGIETLERPREKEVRQEEERERFKR